MLIAFDWDGTLSDSVGLVIGANRALAAEYDLPCPSDDTVKESIGRALKPALAHNFPDASDALMPKLCHGFHDFMNDPNRVAPMFDGVLPLLCELHQAGHSLAVATSKDRCELTPLLEHYRLQDTFAITCCGDEHPSKPNPEMLQRILTESGIGADQAIMVGDTCYDIQMGNAAGYFTIALEWGAHTHAQLAVAKPDAVIAGLSMDALQPFI